MAFVARQMLVWQSPPVQTLGMEELQFDRIEIGIDSVVPDTVPSDVLEDWRGRDWIYEDPTKKHIATSEGPPRTLMPLSQVQKIESAKHASGHNPVLGRTIPPRPPH